MIRLTAFLLVIGALAFWFFDAINSSPGMSSITWGDSNYEMKTATLLLIVLLTCVTFYLALWSLLKLLGLARHLRKRRQQRLRHKASQNLSQGLIHLAGGHWKKAEKTLLDHIEYSDTPLPNYLSAARAAHMQQQADRRDQWLKHALASNPKAHVAVGVTQAEMQLADEQLEQANATLNRLRKSTPRNAHITKLYAKTLYRQKNWDELLELLPELLKLKLLSDDNPNMQRIQKAALQGAFEQYSKRGQIDKLQFLWKKLPATIREQATTSYLYAKSLHDMGNDELAAQFIENVHQQRHEPLLTQLYGRLHHTNPNQAIKKATQWLERQPDNPDNLLLLARLHAHQKLWGVAKSYYESSLTQAPNAEAYLELAELLESMGEIEKAGNNFRTGLIYAIRNNLKTG